MVAVNEKYGMEWPMGSTDLIVELWMFARSSVTPQARYDHLKRAIDLAFNCDGSVRRVIWNEWTERILKACIGDWREVRYLGVAGSSSSGKSDAVALFVLMLYWARPTETYAIVMSTTKQMARKRIWKSINQFWLQAERMGCPGKLVDSIGIIKGINKLGQITGEVGIELVAGDKSESVGASAKILGAKADAQVIIAFDEMTDLADSLLEAVVANISVNPRVFCVGMANPSLFTDPFSDLCEPAGGWNSITEEDEVWKSKLGHVIRLNGEKSPRITEPDGEKFWWQPDEEYIRGIIERSGSKKSRMYYRFVKAFWCPEGLANSVYTESEFIRGVALQSNEPQWDSLPIMISALDPSFTSDGDRTITMMAKLGRVDNRSHLHLCYEAPLQEDVTIKDKPLTFQAVDNWKGLCDDYDVKPTRAIYDSTGAGISFGHIVDSRWTPAVTGINFSSKASERKISYNGRSDFSFYNKRSEMWIQPKKFIRSNQISGMSKECMHELVKCEFHDKSGKVLRVEDKKGYKGREGKSPDLADTFIMLVEKAVDLGHFVSEEEKKVVGVQGTNWRAIMDKRRVTGSAGRRFR